MGHQHYRKAVFPVQLAERIEDSCAAGLVQIAGRLVGQQQPGLRHQGPGDRHPLHLPPRQLPRLVVQPAAQAKPLQQICGPLFRLAPHPPPGRHAIAHQQRCQHIFQRVELREEMVGLKNHADVGVAQPVAAGTGKIIDAFTGEMHFTGIGRIKQPHQVQKRALARATLADDRHKGSGLQIEIDPPQHIELGVARAIALVHSAHLHQQRA